MVDDGSETPPAAAVVSFQERLNVTLLVQSRAGPAVARNAGAERAKGKFLAFTDDDCTVSADWLQALHARFAATPDRMIGGRTVNALTGNPYTAASQLIVDSVYAYYNADPDRSRFFASNNLAIPADRFRALGGFDPTFTTSEDRELCDRWLHRGSHMTYAPEAIVYHAHALTLRTFWRQHFNYGRGAFRFHRIRARRGSGRLRQELGFYTGLPRFLRRALLREQSRRGLMLAALLVVWQGANAAGFAWEGVVDRIHRRSLHGDSS